MNNIEIITENEHFLYWKQEYKKDTTIFDDIIDWIDDEVLQIKTHILNNYDTIKNIKLNIKLVKLKDLLDRMNNKFDCMDEIMLDILKL